MNKKYDSPRIERINIFLEEGIAVGSEFARPQNGSNQIMEQWEQDETETKNIDWS